MTQTLQWHALPAEAVLEQLGSSPAAPLLPLQILWLNLLTDTVPALALAVEPADPAIMRQPPRHPREAILSGRVARATLGYATVISLVALTAFVWGLGRAPENRVYARTLAFMTLAFAQIFHLGNARSGRAVFSLGKVVSNPYALAAVGLTTALQVLTVELQPLADVLRTHPLSTNDWLVLTVLALIPALLGQVVKAFASTREDAAAEERS